MSPFPSRETPERRQAVRLAILLALLAAVLAYRFWPAATGSPTSETPSAARSRAVEQGGDSAGALPEAVELGALEPVPPAGPVTRNPFEFGARPAPPPPPPIERLPPPVVTAPARPPGPPAIPLRLVGITVVPESGRSFVTLSEPSTNGLYHAFEGDIVDGRYRVVQVGPKSVVVSYLDGSGRRTLSLGG
jgi:hypothetical protein